MTKSIAISEDYLARRRVELLYERPEPVPAIIDYTKVSESVLREAALTDGWARMELARRLRNGA